MGRNNPTINQNPSQRWMEWQGSKGQLYYYDKTEEENLFMDLPFTFLLIEQMATVGGWHDRSESGIYSNEVKNITKEPLTVQSFKGGEITSGLYRNIKDQVKSAGGYYVASLYVGFKRDGDLTLGNIKLKGAALSAWMEFCKIHGRNVWEKAITITGYSEGQKGSIEYRVPSFELKDCSEQTHNEALGLDDTLQEYLKSRSAGQVETDETDVPPPSDEDFRDYGEEMYGEEYIEDEGLPF